MRLLDETTQACELLREPKYFRETIIASARTILEDYPHLAPNATVLSVRKPFQRAWHEIKTSQKSPLTSLPTNSQPTNSQPTNPELTNPQPTNPQSTKEQTLTDAFELERVLARQRTKQREDEARIKYLMKALDEAEKRFDALMQIQSSVEPIVIEPKYKLGKNEAASFVLASDWHVEERVDADVVNNLNHYDLNEAARRMSNYFKNVLRLVQKERMTSVIEMLVLWLGGDLMTGYIHEELLETNYLSPIETVLFLKKHLLSGIDFLLNYGMFRQINVVTNHGNHGRTGEHLKVGTGYKNSYEYLLYCELAMHYEQRCEKRVRFNVAKGEFNFVTVFGVKIRTSHGYHIKYAGGVGGITIPAMKFIDRQNRIEKADYDVWGHHHQYFTNPYFCQNGSLIGVSAYGRRYGAEVPKQAYFTIDSKRGIITQMPIFVM